MYDFCRLENVYCFSYLEGAIPYSSELAEQELSVVIANIFLSLKYTMDAMDIKHDMMEGAGRSKFMSRAYLQPKPVLVNLAKGKNIVGADKMTVVELLTALKLMPTHALIRESATKYGIPVSRGDGKEKILRLIRRYEFIRSPK